MCENVRTKILLIADHPVIKRLIDIGIFIKETGVLFFCVEGGKISQNYDSMAMTVKNVNSYVRQGHILGVHQTYDMSSKFAPERRVSC